MILLLFPYALWLMLPAWRTPLAILAALSLLVAIVALARRVRRVSAERAALPASTDWAWRPAWNDDQYRARLVTFLRMSGWRIEPAPLSAKGCIALIARKDRIAASLLCRRPGQPVTETDLAALRHLQRSHATDHAVLISDHDGLESDAVISLPYIALQTLDDYLHV